MPKSRLFVFLFCILLNFFFDLNFALKSREVLASEKPFNANRSPYKDLRIWKELNEELTREKDLLGKMYLLSVLKEIEANIGKDRSLRLYFEKAEGELLELTQKKFGAWIFRFQVETDLTPLSVDYGILRIPYLKIKKNDIN